MQVVGPAVWPWGPLRLSERAGDLPPPAITTLMAKFWPLINKYSKCYQILFFKFKRFLTLYLSALYKNIACIFFSLSIAKINFHQLSFITPPRPTLLRPLHLNSYKLLNASIFVTLIDLKNSQKHLKIVIYIKNVKRFSDLILMDIYFSQMYYHHNFKESKSFNIY